MGNETSQLNAAHLQKLCEHAREAQDVEPPWARNPYQPPHDLSQITQQAINTFMYSRSNDGTMGGLEWWQTPNSYTAITLHDLWIGNSRSNHEQIALAVKRVSQDRCDFINEYNDDTLWWAMLCVHLYCAGGDPWFLDRAKAIWRYVNDRGCVCKRGQVMFRGADMEGACFWTTRDGEEQLNTVTTGLYAELCVRLALIDQQPRPNEDHAAWLSRQKHAGYSEYTEHALCSLGWILRCRYRVDDGIVLDGILLHKDEEVDWTFTYVTGIAVGVCALLYKLLGQPEYLEVALHTANKAMRKSSWVAGNGTLVEPDAYGQGKHDPWQNSDGVGFKAVLMRHLAILYEVLDQTRPDHRRAKATANLLRAFINTNFQSQQERNTNGQGQYGPWWNGPFEAPTSHSQMAVLDIMAAVHLVNAPI